MSSRRRDQFHSLPLTRCPCTLVDKGAKLAYSLEAGRQSFDSRADEEGPKTW